MTPSPPAELARALRAYDPDLRLRWLPRTSLWAIEKKADSRVGLLLKSAPNPYKSARGLDLYEGWSDGYDHVLSVHPVFADNVALVMEHVAEADTWRQGGRAGLLRKLEAQDEAQEREASRAISHFTEAAGSDAYDRLAWGLGNRVAVTTPDPYAKAVRHEDGFVIIDRRITA